MVHRWREMDHPIQYVIRMGKITPVKVFMTVQNWNGAAIAKTITLFDNDVTHDGVQVNYSQRDIFGTKEDAKKELFLRKLKGET